MKTIRLLALAFLTISSVLASGCGNEKPRKEIPRGLDMPVATVDGEPITIEDLLNHPATITVVDELIYEKLILLEAKRRGLTVTNEMVLDEMEKYAEDQGGRENFLRRQHDERGSNFKRLLYAGRLSLLLEQLSNDMLVEPTYDEVVEFLKTDVGSYAFTIKGNELGKDPADVTIEEAYDVALDRMRDARKMQVYENMRSKILPSGHEVVNLLHEVVKNDPQGEAWVEAAPAFEPDAVPEAASGESGEEEPREPRVENSSQDGEDATQEEGENTPQTG